MIDRTLVGSDQRAELAQQHLADSAQFALPLEHSGEPREVRLEPILLTIALGRFAQIGNHCIDVVFQVGHFAAGLHLNRAREVTLGHRRGNLRDRTNLAGEVRSKQVDVAREVPPGTGRAGDVCLSTETAFDTDLTRDVRHLISKSPESIGHIVDGLGEGGDLTLCLDGEALIEITLGHRCHDLGDPADLFGQVRSHEIDVVGEVLPGAGDPRHHGLAAELALGADLTGHTTDLTGKCIELVDHRIDRILQLQDLAFDVDRDLAVEIAACNGRRHLGDVSDLRREIAAHGVHGVGQVLPCARHARNDCLHAEPALRADLARYAGDFRGERAELLDHRVDCFLELQHLAADVDGDLLGKIAFGHRDRDVGDVANLAGQVRRHKIHALGEVLPGAGDAEHGCLAAEFALGTDLTSHPGDFRGKSGELVDHRVDGLLELQDLAFDVDRNLAAQVAARNRRRHIGNVANLSGEVRCHRVDVVGKVLPGAGHAGHSRLAAKLALRSDLACHPAHLCRKGAELIDHGIDGLFELQDLAADIDGDFLRKIAAGNGDRHFGDVSNLARQVVGHRVDVVGEVLPGASDPGDDCLATELAFGADLARHAAHLASKRVELVDHGIDGVLQLQDLAFHIYRVFAVEFDACHGGGDLGDVADLRGEVTAHGVDRVGQILPCPRHAGDGRLHTEPTLGADLARHTGHLGGETIELIDHRVDGVLQCKNLAPHVDCDLAREVSLCDGGRHFRNVADLAGQVRRHEVDAVGEVLPGAGDAGHRRLAAELSFGPHLSRDARHLGGEAVELVDHRVDGFLQLQDLALHIDGDLARKITTRDRRRDLGDVADLRSEVCSHRVHRIGEVLPGAGHARHDGLTAEAAVGADLARHAGDLGSERPELVDHRVDGFLELQNLPAHVDGNFLGQVAVGDSDGHPRDVANLRRQIAGHLVDRFGKVLPYTRHAFDLGLATKLALGADLAGDTGDLRGENRQLLDHRVHELRRAKELAPERTPVHLQLHGLPKVTFGDGTNRSRDFSRRSDQVVQQRVEAIDFGGTPTTCSGNRHTLLEPPFQANSPAQPRYFARNLVLVRNALVEGRGDSPIYSLPV